LGALGVGGVVAAMAVEAATDGAVFQAWLDRVLLPKLRRTRPDAVLVLDNLGAHKTPAVRDLLDRSGFAYRYLPSYSPDLNPIEAAWAKVKSELRRVGARTAEALHRALGPALDAITARDASGFFRHAGYSRPK
jgi:transposase